MISTEEGGTKTKPTNADVEVPEDGPNDGLIRHKKPTKEQRKAAHVK